MELSLGISNQIKFGFLKFADPPLTYRPYVPERAVKDELRLWECAEGSQKRVSFLEHIL